MPENDESTQSEPEMTVNVDGTVDIKENTEETDENDEKVSYDELQKRYEELEEFAANVIQYTVPVDKDDPNSRRKFDLQRIAAEDGYELVKKEEIPIDTSEKVETPTPQKATDNEVTDFSKNPKEFIEKIKNELRDEAVQQVRKELQGELDPIRRSYKENLVRSILSQAREKHSDFDNYQKQIAEIAKDLGVPVDSYKRLEGLYYMAKGRDGGNSSKDTSKSISGTIGAFQPTVTGDEATDVMKRIVQAGAEPVSNLDLTELLGKNRLDPIG